MAVSFAVRSFVLFAFAAIIAGCAGQQQIAPAAGGGSQMQSTRRQPAHVSMLQPWSPLASVIPPVLRPENQLPRIHNPLMPSLVNSPKNVGTYVASFFTSGVLGYAPTPLNRANNPPLCSDSDSSFVNGMTTDVNGNLIIPSGGDRSVYVNEISNFNQSPCSQVVAHFADPYGQPSDAAVKGSALFNTIYVANIFDTSGAGSVSVCTIGGCTANLTNSNIYEMAGVAEDSAGNVYASGVNASDQARLVEYVGGKGGGVLLSGYVNPSYGGLFFDSAGNLGAIAFQTPALYVYSGCPGSCHAHGPFPLLGGSIYGHLDATGKYFVAANFASGQIDVYLYHGTLGINYVYSFNNGLSSGNLVEAVANDPY